MQFSIPIGIIGLFNQTKFSFRKVLQMPEYTSPYSVLSISFVDHSNESSTVQFDMDPLTEANIVAETLAEGALIAAIRDVTLCNPFSSSRTSHFVKYNMGIPASPWAQRELALQVGMIDTVNQKKSHVSIPGVDWATLQGDGDFVDYNNLQWVALKTAIENTVKSSDGNAVQVVYGKLVGRRS